MADLSRASVLGQIACLYGHVAARSPLVNSNSSPRRDDTVVRQIGDRFGSSLLGQAWERMLEIEFIDRGIALAGKAFVSFFPLVIVVAAFVPESVRTSIITTLVHRLGIVGEARQQVRSALASANDIRRATGALGLVLTFLFASSFTTALQRVFLRTWRRPPGGAVYSYVRGISWLAGFIAYLALAGAVRSTLGGGSIAEIEAIILILVSGALVWSVTAWLMLRFEVRFRVLIPTGVLISSLMGAYALVAPMWMPSQITSNLRQFGMFGITLALITWLSGASLCIMAGTCLGVVLVEDDGSMGRLSRLRATTLLVDGARPCLPENRRRRGIPESLVASLEREGL